MVVPCGNHIDWVFKLHFHWNAFRALPPQGSLIIATECVNLSIGGEDNGMKSPASHLVDGFVGEGIGNNLIFVWIVFINNLEFGEIGEAEGFAGVGPGIGKPKLI